MLLPLLTVGLSLAQAPSAPPPSRPAADPVDWDAAGEEAARLLSQYLQVDTINPTGNETRGAVFLAAWLAREGISAEIFEFAPGRGSLVARVEADPDRESGPPLCLLSHIDVAEAEADRWPAETGPLSGAIDADGWVWGRGALDMKGLTAMHAMSMALVARGGIALRRDLVLIAVSDEEVSNLGMAQVAERWGGLGCGHVLNEGGIGIRDLFFDGQDVVTVSVGEKGALWGRVVATGAPGHGSVPLPDQSIDRLLDAIDAIEGRPVTPAYHASLLELLAAVGAHEGGLAGAILQRPALVKTLLRGTFLENPITRAVVTDTANITGLGGAMQPNVVPGEAWANLDARLLPGTDPDAFRASLTAAIDDPHVRIDTDSFIASNVSEWRGDPVYQALISRSVEGYPERVTGPVLSVGYTDSAVARALGARAYGFMPIVATAEQVATMHGDNERVSVTQLTRGVQIMTRVVLDVAGATSGSAPARPSVAWPPMRWPAPDWMRHTAAQPVVPLPPRFAGLTEPPLAAPTSPGPPGPAAPLLAPSPSPWGAEAPAAPEPPPPPPPVWGG